MPTGLRRTCTLRLLRNIVHFDVVSHPSPPGFPQQIEFQLGEYYLDGPIFVKSGVTISGQYSSEFTTYTEFILYEGDNIGISGEDGIIVIDSVKGAEERMVTFPRQP